MIPTKRGSREVQVVAIVFIGETLKPEIDSHAKVEIENRGLNRQNKSKYDSSEHFAEHVLVTGNKVINTCEYSSRIANNSLTYVLQLDDCQKVQRQID